MHGLAACKTQTGFTLLDLILVMIIVAITGMISVPAFNSVASIARLNEAAAETVSALEFARHRAILFQRPFGLRVDTAENRFIVFDKRYTADASPHPDAIPPVNSNGVLFHPIDKTAYQIDFDDRNTFSGVDISAVTPGNEILFHADGHAAPQSPTMVIVLGKEQRVIMVDHVTGKVTVQ
ncbi:MAG: hypothetical protein HKM93_22885 [Desulfobacteraceae bacterium]|nr:hypothetical protein [Desulfobacteraceae bacterium]